MGWVSESLTVPTLIPLKPKKGNIISAPCDSYLPIIFQCPTFYTAPFHPVGLSLPIIPSISCFFKSYCFFFCLSPPSPCASYRHKSSASPHLPVCNKIYAEPGWTPTVRYHEGSAGYGKKCQGAGRHPDRPVTHQPLYSHFSHTACPRVSIDFRHIPASCQRYRLQCNIFPYDRF